MYGLCATVLSFRKMAYLKSQLDKCDINHVTSVILHLSFIRRLFEKNAFRSLFFLVSQGCGPSPG